MKKYEIEINDEIYRVAVRELAPDADMSTSQESAPTDNNPQPVQTEQATPEVGTRAGSEINAPMPGTILKINVESGQAVSKGDTLVILEAMKMENEVVTPTDGVIGEIFVKANQRVESGDLILTL